MPVEACSWHFEYQSYKFIPRQSQLDIPRGQNPQSPAKRRVYIYLKNNLTCHDASHLCQPEWASSCNVPTSNPQSIYTRLVVDHIRCFQQPVSMYRYRFPFPIYMYRNVGWSERSAMHLSYDGESHVEPGMDNRLASVQFGVCLGRDRIGRTGGKKSGQRKITRDNKRPKENDCCIQMRETYPWCILLITISSNNQIRIQEVAPGWAAIVKPDNIDLDLKTWTRLQGKQMDCKRCLGTK